MWKIIIFLIFLAGGLSGMNIGVIFDFPHGKKYYSIEYFSYDGNDFEPIIVSVSPLRIGIGVDHTFEVSQITITVNDNTGNFKTLYDEKYDKYFRGKSAELIETDGSTIRQFYIENGYPAEDSQGNPIFFFILSDLVNELNNNVIEVIDENYFSQCPDKTFFEEPIPRIYNNNPTVLETDIRCRKVERAYLMDYIASSSPIDTLNYAEDSSGNDITSLCTIQQSDGYYYITYSSGSDTEIFINAGKVIGGVATPYDVFKNMAETYLQNFINITFTDTALSNLLQKRDYKQYYSIATQLNGYQIIKQFCDSYGFNWIIDKNRELQILEIDFANITPSKTFQEAEIVDFKIVNADIDQFYTGARVYYAFSNIDNNFRQSVRFNSDLFEKYSKKIKEIYAYYLDDWAASNNMRMSDAHKTWKIHRILHRYPPLICQLTMVDDNAKSLYPGQFISFDHVNALEPGERLYQIRSIDNYYTKNTSIITLWDYDYLKNIRWQDKLLIFQDTFDGSEIMLDESVDGWYNIQNVGPLKWSTAETIVSSSTIRFDGTGYLSVTRGNSYPINPADMGAQANFTVDFWVRFDSTGTEEGFLYFYKNALNYWEIIKTSADKVNFKHISNSVTEINITSIVTIDNKWHHYAICKVGGVIGIYLDGNQILFSNSSITSNESRSGIIASGFGGTIMTGYGTGFHICHDNFFEASPNSGLTDTIYIQNEYGDEMNIGPYYQLLEDFYYELLDDGARYILT